MESGELMTVFQLRENRGDRKCIPSATSLAFFLEAAVQWQLCLLPLSPGLVWTLRGPLDRVMGLPVSHMVGAMDKERPERRLGSTWDWGRAGLEMRYRD